MHRREGLQGPGGLGSGAPVGFASQAQGCGLSREAVASTGRKRQRAPAVRQDDRYRQGLAQQVHGQITQLRPDRGLNGAGLDGLAIEVHQHQHTVEPFAGGAQEGQHRCVVGTDAAHLGPVEEAGMFREQAVERSQILDQIRFGAPGQVAGIVDIDPFRGQPFHAGGETKSPALARQGAETVAQARPGGAATGETEVVVGFAVVHEQPVPLALLHAVVQVGGDLDGVVVLEQFGVRPVHAALGEQGFGGFPGAAQPLQQEDRLRVGLVHLGGDVLPGGQGHHVARIAAEAVHAAPAPGEQRPGHGIPKGGAALIQFHQILPGGTPGAGAVEGAVRVPAEPVGPMFQQPRTPARVVHENVQQDLPAPLMDGGGQFPELFFGGGAPVKIHQGRVDGREVQLRVGTAEAAHAGVGGGHRAHRQQMEEAAAQAVQNVGHGSREIPQGARGGDHRVPGAIQGLDGRGEIGPLPGRCPTEHAGECAVDGVGRAQAIGVDAKARVRAFGPVLKATGIHTIGLGPEEAGLGQGQIQLPAARRFGQGNVPPGGARGIGGALSQQGQGLFAHPCSAREVRAQKGTPASRTRFRVGQGEGHPVPHEAEQLSARGRGHHRVGHGAARKGEGGAYSMGRRPCPMRMMAGTWRSSALDSSPLGVGACGSRRVGVGPCSWAGASP